MRKPLNEAEFEFARNWNNGPGKSVKKNNNLLSKLEDKAHLSSINPYTAILTRYNELKEKHKMSSKHLSNENQLFVTNKFPESSTTNKSSLDYFLKGNNKINNIPFTNTSSGSLALIDHSKITDDFSFAKSRSKSKDKANQTGLSNDNGNNSNLSQFSNSNNRELEEEQLLSEKIKERKAKKNKIKGLTSLDLNRQFGKILVNSMSHSQFIYDAIFYDKYQPSELKGHTSSYYVKSILSPTAEYVLSGSSDASMYIWRAPDKKALSSFANVDCIKLTGFHRSEVILF
jgi:hypothetical protein